MREKHVKEIDKKERERESSREKERKKGGKDRLRERKK